MLSVVSEFPVPHDFSLGRSRRTFAVASSATAVLVANSGYRLEMPKLLKALRLSLSVGFVTKRCHHVEGSRSHSYITS